MTSEVDDRDLLQQTTIKKQIKDFFSMFGHNQIVGEKYFKDAGEKLFVTSIFYTLQGEGPYRGEPAVFVRLAKCNLNCSFCFVPSTPILMGDGTTKNIVDVQVGDMVMSWNGTQYLPKPVIRKYESIANRIMKVEAGARKFWVTPEHPFLTSNRGWVDAQDLTQGDILVHFSVSDRMSMFNPVLQDGFLRKPLSPDAAQKARENLIKLWKDPEFRAANTARMIDSNPMKDPAVAAKGFISRTHHKKSGVELRFEKICEGLPITYIGDGSGETIAHRIPDFIVDGQKKVIEIWAADADFAKDRDDTWVANRRKLFEKNGYETMFLPLMPTDLRSDNHQRLREKVASFVHNGIVITKVSEVKDGRGFARLYGSKTAERTVYNLEVEDTHTYLANNCVVHNCDTFFDDGDWLTIQEIDARIEQTITEYFEGEVPMWARELWGGVGVEGDNSPQVPLKKREMVLVVTGGEPMLQKNLVPFLEYMNKRFAKTQIESNGTIVQNIPAETTLVVSPKCSEKHGVAVKYLEPKQEMLARADCLKFVMSAKSDSPYAEVPNWAHNWHAITCKPVFVSPMNIYNSEPQKSKQLRASKNQISLAERSTTDEVISFWEAGLLNMQENQINHEFAAKYCINHGFIFNMQLHLFASLA